MEAAIHRFHELFAQLGLADDAASIERFIAANAPLPAGAKLHDAPFWTTAQAGFLREACMQDADWAALVDQLSVALHQA
ncbi:MAG: DUF2789 domain-containing protein [Comamonadaceae bacterium CG_4_9_14_3_um_filter_60_33]|nr:MAG: hypothetical protein AUK51_00290 [Comamonadaceae bacterium CG2_30_59_20]PIY27574.1 MAG: DUF2789 domain-containing protein [Comamonadaceae bacterium CG_4_10_14_3_um_filter_60_42]PJB45440.1 MAG: DUF2789 domain-containing protein [Comamonadaceae bacterium CG_4_9_14_3_um_filter_60_33]